MKPQLSKALGSVTALVALLACAGLAVALPPDTSSVLAQVATTTPKPDWAQASFLEVGSPERPARRGLRVQLSPKGAIRLDISDLRTGARETFIWAAADDGARGGAAGPAPMWLQLLAGRPVGSVIDAAGVDRTVTSYAHVGTVVSSVVGARPAAPWLPQLQVERVSGRVVSVTEPLTMGGVRAPVSVSFEGRFGDHPPTGLWPARIVFTAVPPPPVGALAPEPPAAEPTAFELRALSIGSPLPPETFVAPPSPGP